MRTATLMTVDGVFSEVRELSRKAARWANVESESGVTAIEYAVLAVIVVVAIVAIGATLSSTLTNAFQAVSNKVSAAAGS